MTHSNISRHDKILIIDFKPIFVQYSKYAYMYKIYEVFSIKEMLGLILSCYYDRDIIETFDHCIDERLSEYNPNIEIDMNVRDIFVWEFMEEVELHIQKSVNGLIDYSEYTLNNWLNETTAILVK